ncbi:hypothetical protein [Streptomyces inhibens]|uniref:hypothetical protein n=1 Tax=Streptomyces inhibens TaxID=2293571 RepID=UPI001FD173AC|nr:hypothetical protein [Streptomyces inhibens]
MNLINDSDRHKARMMYVMALKPSKDTAHRVARQHLTAAQNGSTQGASPTAGSAKASTKGSLSPMRPTDVASLLARAAGGDDDAREAGLAVVGHTDGRG